jgi:hypothetical protein
MQRKNLLPIVLCTTIFFFFFSLLIKSPTIYVSLEGNDANPGTKQRPVRTIQRGVSLAIGGGTLRIAPGDYRETVSIPPHASVKKLTLTRDPQENGTVRILGSDPASTYRWQLCKTAECMSVPFSLREKIYVADIPFSEPPETIYETTAEGISFALPLAKSPNEQSSGKKQHLSWFGNGQSSGTPTTLIDPQIASLPEISGARVFLMDGGSRCGAFLHVRSVTKTDQPNRSLYFDSPVGAITYGRQEAGIGTHTKYYVEDALALLDEPGEWYADKVRRKLYLWPKESVNPARLPLEIGARSIGIAIDRSRVEVRDITLQNFNSRYTENNVGAITIHPSTDLFAIDLARLSVANAAYGIYAEPKIGGRINGLRVRDSSLTRISRSPIFISGDDPKDVTRVDIDAANVSDSGYPFNSPAIFLTRVSRARIRNSVISDTASYGIHVTGHEKQGTTTRNIRIEKNNISNACQNASACAGIKIFGGAFKETILVENSVDSIQGWSYCHQMQEKTSGYGIGVFISNASGITVRNNRAHHITGPAYLAFTRQLPATDNRFYGNFAAYSQVGIALDGSGDSDTDRTSDALRHRNTILHKNILVENDIGMRLDPAQRNFVSMRGNQFVRNALVAIFQGETFSEYKQLERYIR